MTDLHNKIMNLPCVLPPGFDKYGTEEEHSAYKFGHREARHAAAELASAEIESNRAAIDELVAALKLTMASLNTWHIHYGVPDASRPVVAAGYAALAKHQTTTEKEQ